MPQIDTDAVYKQLKKQNGEAVAHVIRDAVLLDVPNIVHILEFAGRNADEVAQLVPLIREIYKGKERQEQETDKTPLELLSEAGYEAWFVNNVKEQNAIAGYFRSPKAAAYNMTGGHPRSNGSHEGLSSNPKDNGELLCTVYTNLDSGAKRFNDYFVIHAVKKEALGDDKLAEEAWHIKPSDNPRREDEYGTSVISIQILKTGGFISIKNRYNHTVHDPDNTFNNNPDKIIPGLSYALKKYFQVDFYTTDAEIPPMYRMIHDQLVRYNYEMYDMYFGDNYCCQGSTITKLNNNNQILFYAGFVLTIAKGKNTIESILGTNEPFCTELNNFLRDKKISIAANKDTKIRTVFVNGMRFMDLAPGGYITFIYPPKMKELRLEYQGIKLSGDLDFRAVTEELDLDMADLSNVTSIKVNPNILQIDLSDTKLAGNIDLSTNHFARIRLTNADFTNVKSIKLNYFTYKAKKNTIVMMNGERIPLRDVSKHGVKVKFTNSFSLATKKIQTGIALLKLRKHTHRAQQIS